MMEILGIGTIFSGGRGIAALEHALQGNWQPPGISESPLVPGGLAHAAISPESLTDKAVLGGPLRRADRFSRMAVLAAADALAAAGPIAPGTRIGLIVGTAFGPHVTTFKFLDEILDHGDPGVSPTVFSHSVHNVAAAYIGLATGVRGPAATVTHFNFAFHHALLLADSWLRENRCELVLAGAVDELGPVLEHVCSRKLTLARDGRIRPFLESRLAGVVPGEGAAFFLLGHPRGAGVRIRCLQAGGRTMPPPADLTILEEDGLTGGETAWATGFGNRRLAAYAPIYGSQPAAGSAFSCAIAAQMLKTGSEFASPVPENPGGLVPGSGLPSGQAQRMVSCRFDCAGETGAIELMGASTLVQ
jgi:3-oxoacyl-[acyl-carrier-protein] synthase II